MAVAVRLERMSRPEFEQYLARTLPAYTEDVARAMGWEPADTRGKVEAQIAGLLPQGERTPGHHFEHIVVDGARAGVLWYAEQPAETPPRVFVYDLVVDAAQRGRGIGTAAMRALEEVARGLGAEQLMLSVFEHNTGAIRLYERLGFVAHERGLGGMHMSKRIAS